MPYLPTSQAFLEESALLLEAYPDTTKTTTKYHFPSTRPSTQARKRKQEHKARSQPSNDPNANKDTTSLPPAPPVATLTLKTFHPPTGICLKYRTHKAAEVARLITSLGRLAGGADVASLGLGGSNANAGQGQGQSQGEVEMGDAEGAAAEVNASGGAGGKGSTNTNTNNAGSGKGKGKKGGKKK